MAMTPRNSHIAAATATLLFLGMAHGLKLAPALFIFGDSLVDAGNNNYINTAAKANPNLYGTKDLPHLTGRFTNGRTFADWTAEFLGLDYQPPALKPNISEKQMLQGLNYASGSAGILNETLVATTGGNINLTAQVGLFRDTLNKHLKLHEKSEDLKTFKSKSIFILFIGNNDILEFALKHGKDKPNVTLIENYTQLLTDKLGDSVKELYTMGARKFVVSEIWDKENEVSKSYNKKLETKLKDLGSKLPGSIFVTVKAADFMVDIKSNYRKYGFDHVECTGDCSNPSAASKAVMMGDKIHPTELTYRLLATRCFNGTGTCVPINIQQLASK